MRGVLILAGAVLIGIFLILMQRGERRGGPGGGNAVEVDSPAPPFQLQDLDGNTVSLADFQGKIVMLDFWATWCGPCRMTMPLLEELQQEHPDDFTLLAINLGEPLDLVLPYVKRQGIHSPVLLDIDNSVGSAYGSHSIPMQVIIDQKGTLRFIQTGFYAGMKEDLWEEIRKLQ
ncbi:MAG: hypothetical protein H6Q05_4097 [Acidobacteria bacterium]|nr:hypothetical protein [Acidobacteriota bacterium]